MMIRFQNRFSKFPDKRISLTKMLYRIKRSVKNVILQLLKTLCFSYNQTMDSAVDVSHLKKVFNPFPLRKKERGPGLWVANIMRLRRIKENEVYALTDVSFSVNRGEIFAVLGPNGAGKTTLMKILSGLLYPTSGAGTVLGKDIVKEHNKLKGNVSFVSASFWMALEWQFTVMENILQYAILSGVREENAKKRTKELGEFFGIDFFDKKIPELSAGMRQIVAVIRGFVIDRPIVYLDEPGVSLDVEKRHQLSELVKSEAKKGKTILISSHEFTDLDIYNPRALLLKKGKTIGIGTAEELLREKNAIPYELQLSKFDDEIRKELSRKGIIEGDIPKELIELDRVFKVRLLVKRGMVNGLVKILLKHNVKIFNMRKDRMSLKDAYLYRVKYA
ncbi:MAG: ABC transporter ATP-binding protein [Caldisericaceae bacterium]|nr:ABC transporter ATP-binding protein [Caldisericaceae bacterium]